MPVLDDESVSSEGASIGEEEGAHAFPDSDDESSQKVILESESLCK